MTPNGRLLPALSLAFVLTFVPATVCCIAIAGGYDSYLEIRRRRDERLGGRVWTRESFAIDSSGRLLIQYFENNSSMGYLDENRQPIWVKSDDPPRLSGCALWSPETILPWLTLHDLKRQRAVEHLDSGDPSQRWFFVYDHRTKSGVFECYDTASARRIGTLSLAGFRKSAPDDRDRFPVEGPRDPNVQPSCLLARCDTQYQFREYESAGVQFDGNQPLRVGQCLLLSGDRLFLIDLIARSSTELVRKSPVRSMAMVTRVVPLPGGAGARPGAGPLQYEVWLAVQTAGRIVLTRPNSGEREEYLLPAEWQGRNCSLYLPADGSAILSEYVPGSQREPQPDVHEHDYDIIWLAHDGTILKKKRLTLESTGSVTGSTGAFARVTALAIPGPICSASVLAAVAFLVPVDYFGNEAPASGRLVAFLSLAWPSLVVVVALALILTWLADRRMHALGLPRSYVWLTFVFLFGLPGYLAWLCHRPWPVKRPAPPPQPTGVEVFA